MTQNSTEYLLGVNQSEFDRLQFQHSVWRENTNAFIHRLGVGTGWHCLDVGAGPGFVSMELRNRVGETGSVTALEPSALFLGWLQEQARQQQWTNVRTINATVEEAELPNEQYDFIFIRWVIAFVADPQLFFSRLLASLKPGGIIAVQDYYYEGLSLFPRGGAFDGMADVVRRYYASVGGDPYITGKLPAWFKQHHLSLIDYTPHSYAGEHGSLFMEWGHRFFSTHIEHMVAKQAATPAQGEALLADWMAHYNNPDAIFFTPIVVDAAGRKA